VKHYNYTDQLTPEELADPIIASAYAVAQCAHEGRTRGKLNDLPELVHPVLVYRMAKRMGETNPQFLAAALLHDTLEDCKQYRKFKNHPRMRDDLLREMEARGVPKARRVAGQIFDLVREVTKPDRYDQGIKLLAQIDHMQHASIDGKRLKILDQTASLVCRLIDDNDPTRFTARQEEAFLPKATNLVQAIVRSARGIFESEALQPYEQLYALALDWVQRMPGRDKPRVARAYYRSTLDFDALFHDRLAYHRVVQIHEPVAKRYYPPHDKHVTGEVLLRIDFADDGRIHGCVIRNDPGGGENTVNQQQEKLPAALLQAFGLYSRAETLDIEAQQQGEHEGGTGRHYIFKPAVPAKVFAAATRLSGMLSHGESLKFERKMDALSRGDAAAR